MYEVFLKLQGGYECRSRGDGCRVWHAVRSESECGGMMLMSRLSRSSSQPAGLAGLMRCLVTVPGA